MITLYARSGSGSAAVEALLAECGVEFQIVEVPREGPAFDEFLKINPRGEVPALRLLDNTLMTESAAMMIYLADYYQDHGLAPMPNSASRPAYLRWILYFAASVYMADLRYFYPARHSVDPAAAVGIKAKSAIDLDRDFSIFSNALGKGPYILGEIFSAADIYAMMLISWAPDIKEVFVKYPNIKRLYDLVAARPKINPVWDRNGMIFHE